ncbi:MAG TPA: gamma-glutamyltransferase [Rhodanobacteraceae bacterium]|nr:gamma-glutamyltransferase [Rhodanobacteraceae bacterium]
MKRIVAVFAFVFLIATGCGLSEGALADTAKPGRAAIASAHKLATDAGFEVLGEGGNAFDAAVAVAAALSVLEPQSSGIGGGGLFLLRRASDGKETMVDAREMAPAAVDPKDYLKPDGEANRDHSTIGPLSAAIPGEPAGIVYIAQHYGKLPLSKSLAPAIRLAREGYEPDSRFLGELARRKEAIKRFPASAALYLVNGEAPQEGWVFKTPDLAHVLELIAAHGNDGFYKGEIAKKLVDGVRAEGGRWTLDDLAAYEVKERKPLTSEYKGYRMVTAPPPSSGGIAIAEILNILSGYDLSKYDHAHQVHLAVEAMRRAYRDRAEYLGDPDFVKMPIERLMSLDYAAGLRASIHPEKATPSDLLPGYLDTQQGVSTSHFSIIDKDGNLVSATQTVNLIFGSAFVVPGTGFVLNDEMDDFALVAGKPNAYGLLGNDRNAPKPHSRPLSSMSPTFVYGPDRLAVLGTPGGSSIITMTLEGILAFIGGETPEQFVANRRYHHQYMPDVINAEKDALSADDIQQLEAMGHKINVAAGTWPYGFMNAVSWDRKSSEMHAAADPRGVSGSGQVR